jgi:hypothetical protein
MEFNLTSPNLRVNHMSKQQIVRTKMSYSIIWLKTIWEYLRRLWKRALPMIKVTTKKSYILIFTSILHTCREKFKSSSLDKLERKEDDKLVPLYLKLLRNGLKYAFLDETNIYFTIIISSNLSDFREKITN